MRRDKNSNVSILIVTIVVVICVLLAAIRLRTVRRVVSTQAPLLMAIDRGASLNEIQSILNKNPTLRDKPELGLGRPIDHAARLRRYDIVELLLKRGAEPNGQDMLFPDSFSTLLHSAAVNDDVQLAELLLTFGAKPALADSEGQTPAEVAKETGSKRVLELLESDRQ
jgi:ankyrin repeat protein